MDTSIALMLLAGAIVLLTIGFMVLLGFHLTHTHTHWHVVSGHSHPENNQNTFDLITLTTSIDNKGPK